VTSPTRSSSALALVERESGDARNFVKKAVSWALRTIGNRSAECHAAAIALSRRLAESDVPSARWIGKDALRDLQRPLVLARARSRGTARALIPPAPGRRPAPALAPARREPAD
jgi:hypothetical protein